MFLGSSLLNSAGSLPGAKPVLHKCDDIFKKYSLAPFLPRFCRLKGLKPDIPDTCYIYLLYVCVYITLVYRKNITMLFFFWLGGRMVNGQGGWIIIFFNKHKHILKEILVTDHCFQTL